MQILMLGRQPEISLAEIESLHPELGIELISDSIVQTNSDIDISMLGGVIKSVEQIGVVDSEEKAFSLLSQFVVSSSPTSKVNIGLSVYEYKSDEIYKKLISTKKALKSQDISSRIVNQPKDTQLNSAQVIHNRLTSKGYEFNFIKSSQGITVGITKYIQDIEKFSQRDQKRPARDAKIGMLPPKLALILVNLALGTKSDATVVDPFCGTGVVLQEALLRDVDVIGTDLNEDMVRASKTNLDWLKSNQPGIGSFDVYQGDARTATWSGATCFAAETYLGPPLSSKASDNFFTGHLDELNKLHLDFLNNVHEQLAPGSRLALALPAWWISSKNFKRLPLVDHLSDIGYNLVDFKNVRGPLMYHRDGQYVARDIVVLTRI